MRKLIAAVLLCFLVLSQALTVTTLTPAPEQVVAEAQELSSGPVLPDPPPPDDET